MGVVSSELEVINLALSELGEPRMLAMNDTGRIGGIVRASFNIYRDTVMRCFSWNCNTDRTALSEILPAPLFGYAHRYLKPAHFLRVLEINGDKNVAWTVEGDSILTDLGSPIELRYLFRQTDVTKWDAGFVTALAARCRLMWCAPLQKDNAEYERAKENHREAFREAVSVDSIEKGDEVIDASSWIDSRRSGFTVPIGHH